MRVSHPPTTRPCDRALKLAHLPAPPKTPRKHTWTPDEILCLRHYRTYGSTWRACSTAMDANFQILVSANACSAAYYKYRENSIVRSENGGLVFVKPSSEVRGEREEERRVMQEESKKRKEMKEEKEREWTDEEISHVRYYRGVRGCSFEEVAIVLDSCCQCLVSAGAVERFWMRLVEREKGAM